MARKFLVVIIMGPTEGWTFDADVLHIYSPEVTGEIPTLRKPTGNLTSLQPSGVLDICMTSSPYAATMARHISGTSREKVLGAT